MTRFKLFPWLAAAALLLLMGPVRSTAIAAPPLDSVEEPGGMIYLPMDGEQAWMKSASGLNTSTAGEVTLGQYGAADGTVSIANGMLSVRFDPPFDAPYTITGISFPTRTQFQIAGKPASFISVRVVGMNPTTGLPDKTMELFQQRRYLGSNNGGMNTIPLSISGTPGQTFFVVFQFPRPPASADTFPFLFTDRAFTDKGLFATSFVTDSNAVVRVPAVLGTFPSSAVLLDQNIVCSMTCALSGSSPMNAPSGLGLNLRDTQANWTWTAPANVLADGEAAPSNYLDSVELVRLDSNIWTAIASGGAGSGKVTLPSVPGSGLQTWGVRSVDTSNRRSAVSNVTMTGSSAVNGYSFGVGEDAQEANGKATETEASALTLPVVDQSETVWPAGDVDNYWFYAQPGQEITVRVALPIGAFDFRNDMLPVVRLLDNSHDVVADDVATAGNVPVTLSYTAAPPSGNSGSKAFKRYYVQVEDKSGSSEDPLSAPRVLIPATYQLSVDVTTPTAFAMNDDPSTQSGARPSQDSFSFANSGANPIRGAATFSYAIPRGTADVSVRLRIYDVRGRLVSTVVNAAKSAGTYFAGWSGHDARGNRVSSGPYFARFEAGSYSRTVRIDLVN